MKTSFIRKHIVIYYKGFKSTNAIQFANFLNIELNKITEANPEYSPTLADEQAPNAIPIITYNSLFQGNFKVIVRKDRIEIINLNNEDNQIAKRITKTFYDIFKMIDDLIVFRLGFVLINSFNESKVDVNKFVQQRYIKEPTDSKQIKLSTLTKLEYMDFVFNKWVTIDTGNPDDPRANSSISIDINTPAGKSNESFNYKQFEDAFDYVNEEFKRIDR